MSGVRIASAYKKRNMPKIERKSRILDPAGIQFIEPMYALAVQNLPVGDQWLYEVKFDGYRCLAGRGKDSVTLWSRRGNLFTDQFPQIARACERLPASTLLDGEIVAIDQSGRISFNLLQHHRSHAQALLFYAFDVLIYRGENLLKIPLQERRKILSEIFDKLGKEAARSASRKRWTARRRISCG
jgi:bifunctional non-homologous end joining protein LigD